MEMTGKKAIDNLLDASPELWRGRRPNQGQSTVPTQHARLDACLPGGGWPLGAVSEVISCTPGLGEMSLLLPALAALAGQGQWVVLIDPPWIPYPAALHGHSLPLERLLLVRSGGGKASLWACEQALRCGRGGAVLAWPEQVAFARLRRLQLAAREHAKLAFLLRPQQALNEPSPAALRLYMEPAAHHGAHLHVIKCRGARPADPVWLARPFSRYGKQLQHTAKHEPFNSKHERPALAGHSPAAPRPGPAYPRAEHAEDSDRAQRPGGAARTDH